MLRCNLPEQINLKNEVLKPVIGGHLEGVPFLKEATTNGWANGLHEIQTNLSIISEAKRIGVSLFTIDNPIGDRAISPIVCIKYSPVSQIILTFTPGWASFNPKQMKR